MTLHPVTLLNYFINFNSFAVKLLNFLRIILCPLKTEVFLFFLVNLEAFYLLYFILIAGTSSTMLSSDKKHPSFVVDLKGKLSAQNLMVSVVMWLYVC